MGAPRAAWWAYKLYSDGVGSRIVSTTTDSRVVALGSSQTDTSKKAQVLVGYLRNPFVTDASPTTVSVSLARVDALSFMSGHSTAHVKIEKIPDSGEQVVSSPQLVSDWNSVIFE
jgi:hypothetical protein